MLLERLPLNPAERPLLWNLGEPRPLFWNPAALPPLVPGLEERASCELPPLPPCVWRLGTGPKMLWDGTLVEMVWDCAFIEMAGDGTLADPLKGAKHTKEMYSRKLATDFEPRFFYLTWTLALDLPASPETSSSPSKAPPSSSKSTSLWWCRRQLTRHKGSDCLQDDIIFGRQAGA